MGIQEIYICLQLVILCGEIRGGKVFWENPRYSPFFSEALQDHRETLFMKYRNVKLRVG